MNHFLLIGIRIRVCPQRNDECSILDSRVGWLFVSCRAGCAVKIHQLWSGEVTGLTQLVGLKKLWGIGCWISGFGLRVLGFEFRVSCFGFRPFETGLSVPNDAGQARDMLDRIHEKHQILVLGKGFRISNLGFKVCGMRFEASILEIRV
jgi:hypothetical protein